MNKKHVLILTDHSKHSSENSLYALAVAMLEHPMTEDVCIASRANEINADFFSCVPDAALWATQIDQSFRYRTEEHPLDRVEQKVSLDDYAFVWLRMPPPLSNEFLHYLEQRFNKALVINNPSAIELTGSKAFLINFPSVCPPMKLCTSLEDIEAFRKLFPIVLKPYNEYGGRGIVKIDNGMVSEGSSTYPFEAFAEKYKQQPVDYLGVKFLKNVTEGDKRIVVVNGKVLGASVRMPAENSWICNVAMGGSSGMAEVEAEEYEIIKVINPKLTELGIVMYGVDTLVDDDGKRVLSEINTTSIGGLPQIAAMREEPLVEKAIDLIWDYYLEKTNENGK